MSTAIIINVLQKVLANPDIHPRSREGMKGRLRHYQGLRRPEQDNARAIAAGIRSRTATAQKMREQMMPRILEMKAEGMTYRNIALVLEKEGFVSLKGTPFSHTWIGKMLRDHAAGR